MPLTGSTGMRGIGQMPVVHALQHVIWKIPGATGSAGKNDDNYYDGSGNVQPKLAGNSTSIRKFILGQDIIHTHYTNPKSLAYSLTGLSNFSPYAFTLVKDKNYETIYDNLQYNSLIDFCDAMITDHNFERIMYVEQYIMIDDAKRTPEIKGRNIAYWNLVGKNNYQKKTRGGLISDITNFEARNPEAKRARRERVYPVGQTILADQIAKEISNNFIDFKEMGGLSGFDMARIIRPSEPKHLHNWPYLNGTNDLYDAINKSSDRSPAHMIYDRNNGVVRPFIEYSRENGSNPSFICSNVIHMSFIFTPSFGKSGEKNDIVTVNSRLIWTAKRDWKSIHSWSAGRSDNNGNYEIDRIVNKSISESYKKNGRPRSLKTKLYSSDIVLFEWVSEDENTIYYTIKPLSEDTFSLKNTSDAYNPKWAYLFIEEIDKKAKLERIPIDQVTWSDIYNPNGGNFETSYGFMGSFSKADILKYFLTFDGKQYYTKYKKGNRGLKISVLLSSINSDEGGNFVSPSRTGIVFDTTKLFITEIKTKTLEATNKSI